MNRDTFRVALPEGEALRADAYVAGLGLFTRSQLRRREIRFYWPDGREVKPSRRVKDGEELIVTWEDPPASEILPEPIPLDIIYEDDDAVVVNKPQGMVVHPANGHLSGTLVQGLLYRYGGWDDRFEGDRVRPGIVHRLDKDTSGIIVVAKSPEAHEFIAAQFRNRSVEKSYRAILQGVPRLLQAEIETTIGRDPADRKRFAAKRPGGKKAITRYQIMASDSDRSFAAVDILTGRTHQIRVHMRHIGCPVLGDPIYGRRDPRFPGATLMLHARRITVILPSNIRRTFAAPLPERFNQILDTFREPVDKET